MDTIPEQHGKKVQEMLDRMPRPIRDVFEIDWAEVHRRHDARIRQIAQTLTPKEEKP